MTIRRPDGSYIFHFVNVVDDIEMQHDPRHSAARTTSPTPGSTSTSSMPSEPPPPIVCPHPAHPEPRWHQDEQARCRQRHRAQLHERRLPPRRRLQLPLHRSAGPRRAESERTTQSRRARPPLRPRRAIHSGNAKFDHATRASGSTRSISAPSAPAPCFKPPRGPSSTAKGLTPSPTTPCRRRRRLTACGRRSASSPRLPAWVHYFFRAGLSPSRPTSPTKLKAKPENAALLHAAAAKLPSPPSPSGAEAERAGPAVEAAAKANSASNPARLMPLLRVPPSAASHAAPASPPSPTSSAKTAPSAASTAPWLKFCPEVSHLMSAGHSRTMPREEWVLQRGCAPPHLLGSLLNQNWCCPRELRLAHSPGTWLICGPFFLRTFCPPYL
jgi:hypothetical protein